jgi:hypothetical protein
MYVIKDIIICLECHCPLSGIEMTAGEVHRNNEITCLFKRAFKMGMDNFGLSGLFCPGYTVASVEDFPFNKTIGSRTP